VLQAFSETNHLGPVGAGHKAKLIHNYSRTFERIIPYLLEGDDSGQKFALRNAAKDMHYYTQLAASAATTAFVADAVHRMFVLATNPGHGDKHIPRLFDVPGEINGVKVRASS